MIRGIARSLAVTLATIAVFEAAVLAAFVGLCDKHRAWERVSSGRSVVVRESGNTIARPGEAIYACTTRHCFGPLCHDDLGCYCAPASIDRAALDALVVGRCALDQPGSAPAASGGCRNARCDAHVGQE